MSHAKEAELQKAFSLADTDGSGLITEEEFYQMYRNQGERRETAQQWVTSQTLIHAEACAQRLTDTTVV